MVAPPPSAGTAPARTVSAGTVAACGAALMGFAFNSLLCRLALRPDLVDFASFTALRLCAGAVVMALFALTQRSGARVEARAPGPAGPQDAAFLGGSAWAAGFLIVYAVAFSLAYREMEAGTGSLVLFGSVQVTMIGWGLRRGERPGRTEWLGLAISLAGLLALLRPSASGHSVGSAALMALAGVCWAAYSLAGRGSRRPLQDTAGNFVRVAPLACALVAAMAWSGRAHVSATGAAYAVASGALASGVGYALWYRALRHLSATRAAILQLSVPVLAAVGGVVLLGEHITLRLAAAGGTVLAGVALAVLGR